MPLIISTGLKNAQLAPVPALFDGGAIFVYTGDQPVSSDLAPTGVLLGVISKNGAAYTLGSPINGLKLVATTGGFLTPDPTQSWGMLGLVDGLAGWARFVTVDDTLEISHTLPRIDTPVVSTGVGMLLPEPRIIFAGQMRLVTYFLYGIPPFIT